MSSSENAEKKKIKHAWDESFPCGYRTGHRDIVGHKPLSMLHYIQTPYNRAITYCTMMEEHVSFPGQDTLTGLLVEFTVKACVGQLRVVHTAKNIHLIHSFSPSLSKHYFLESKKKTNGPIK